MQDLKGNADGFGIAAQGGDGVTVAMIIGAAAQEQPVLRGKGLQKMVDLFGMGGVENLKPGQPVILELSNKGGHFFEGRVRADRVGEYSQAVGFFNSVDYFVGPGFDMFDKGWGAVFEEAAEGFLAIFGQTLLGKQAGKVGATHLAWGNFGQFLGGYGDAEGLEAFHYSLVAVVTCLLQSFNKGAEPGRFRVEAVAENMERNPIEGAAYLYSPDNLNPGDCPVGESLGKPRYGVVIGEGDGRKPTAGGKVQQGGGGQQPVRKG